MEAVSISQKDKISQMLEQDPHRAFDAQGLASTLKPPAVKDPQQIQQLASEITADLKKLVEEGKVREVLDGGYKARLFTNETRHIEHAFIGGMGNVHFRFKSPLFRLNIGVLSLFFIKSQKEGNWMLLVRDTTAGICFCLRTRLKDGSFQLGSDAQKTEVKDYIPVVGRYIEKHHATITLRKDEVLVEDHKTLVGSRIDLLTDEGLAFYREAVQEFLKAEDPAGVWDPVSRGRFVINQLLRQKKDFETTFFGAAVDSFLLESAAGK